jgi:hypothetical protein
VKLFGYDLVEVDDMPEGEIVFAQRERVRLVPSTEPDGSIRLTLVQDFKQVGKITGLQ